MKDYPHGRPLCVASCPPRGPHSGWGRPGAETGPHGRPLRVAPRPKSQWGAAIITAMLTVTLVASLAAAALWQQWRSIEIETATRGRLQAGWILVGALDWARLILREDARSGPADHLAEPWAIPLEEAKLTTFFAAQASAPGGGSAADEADKDIIQAYMSGQMLDLQSRLNLRNLVDGGQVSAISLAHFGKLFEALGLDPAELARVAENLRFALDTSSDNRNAARAPLLPQRYEQLTWLGLSPASLRVLEPYATWLPERTAVNLNTASEQVINATLPENDLALARRLVTSRKLAHFKNVGEAARILGDVPGQLVESHHSVSSRYFEVRGLLRLDDLVVQERSLVVRDGLDIKTLWRERVALPPPKAASLQ